MKYHNTNFQIFKIIDKEIIITLQNQLGIARGLSACETVGGKTVANINDPLKLMAAGLTDAKICDKLDITLISKEQILVKNIRTGSSVKLGYEYDSGSSAGSGYLSKDVPTTTGVE